MKGLEGLSFTGKIKKLFQVADETPQKDYSALNILWESSQFSSSPQSTKRLLIPVLMSLLRKSWHWHEQGAHLKATLKTKQGLEILALKSINKWKPYSWIHSFLYYTNLFYVDTKKKRTGMEDFYTESVPGMTDSGRNHSYCIWPSTFSCSESQFLSNKKQLQKQVHYSRLGHCLLCGNLQGPKLTKSKKWSFKLYCRSYFIPSSHMKTYDRIIYVGSGLWSSTASFPHSQQHQLQS